MPQFAQDNKQLRLVFTGPHSTGKTTLVEMLVPEIKRVLGIEAKVVSEVARVIMRRGLPMHRESTPETYCSFIEEHMHQEMDGQGPIVLLDRFLPDYYAYALVNGNCPEYILRLMHRCHMLLNARQRYSPVYYIPIEFPIEGDGERNTDEEYRWEVDRTLRKVLKDWHQPYRVLTGSREDRINQVLYSLEIEQVKSVEYTAVVVKHHKK